MKKTLNFLSYVILSVLCAPALVFAEGAAGASGDKGLIAIGAGLAIALAAYGGTSGQGRAISSGLDSIGRNPAAAGKIFTPMIVGLVLIESLVIISFVIAFMLVGVVKG